MRVLLFALSLAAICPAQAAPREVIPRDVDAFRCLGSTNMYAPLANYREQIAALHRLHSRADTLRICNDALSNHHYFLRDIHYADGACHMTEYEVFPMYTVARDAGSAPRETISSWSDTPPKLWSDKGYAPQPAEFEFAAKGPCPRAGGALYGPFIPAPSDIPAATK